MVTSINAFSQTLDKLASNTTDLRSTYGVNETDIITTNTIAYASVSAPPIQQQELPKRTAAGLYLNNKNEVIW